MKNRIVPTDDLSGIPCSIVAVAVANGGKVIPAAVSKSDGYMTLNDMNKYIRNNLDVAKRKDFKRGERPILRDLELADKAIICVRGHYIYADRDSYFSFFDNLDDEVIAVWYLKDKA